MKCQNCNTPLSCGCQKKIASDGQQVCSTCSVSYENKLSSSKNTQINNGQFVTAVIK